MKKAIVNATVYPVTSPPIFDGVVVVEEKKVIAVGGRDILPPEAEIIEAQGRSVIPGLVEAHTHLGIFETHIGWEGSDGDEVGGHLAFPYLRALDAINPADEMFLRALSVGVTTALVVPSSLTVIGGQTVILKTAPKAAVDEMVVREPAGMKMALGENPKRENAIRQRRFPVTRMGIASTIRKTLVDAQNYREAGSRPRDLGHEAMVKVLERQMPIHIHVHRADDIVTALRIVQEFEVDLVIHHGTESYLVAEQIAAAGIPVVYGPIGWWSYKSETRNVHGKHVRELLESGILVTITTDAPVIPIQHLDDNFAEIRESGVSAQQILEMLTINSARILGIEDRVGSIEPGKDADLVILEGDPMEPGTRTELVLVEGEMFRPSEMLG